MSETIRVNGEEHRLQVGTVVELLRAQEIDPAARGVAVAVNGTVVPRRDWLSAEVKDGDEIEIVRPFAGG